jgi:hypothetical protein
VDSWQRDACKKPFAGTIKTDRENDGLEVAIEARPRAIARLTTESVVALSFSEATDLLGSVPPPPGN